MQHEPAHKKQLTDNGKRVLDALRADPCQTQEALAKNLGLSRETVRQHLQILEKLSLVIGKGYILNERSATTQTRCVLIRANKTAFTEKTLEKLLSSLPCVTSCLLVTGEYDFVVSINDRDTNDFRSIIARIRANDSVESAITLDVIP